MNMTPARAALLREMGFAPLWRPREAPPLAAPARPRPSVAAAPQADPPPPAPETPAAAPQQSSRPAPAALLRPRVQPTAPPAPTPVAQAPDGEALHQRAARIATLGWDELEADIRACRACPLCEQRKQAVPGVGDRQADWLLVGEGPGRDEDERGEPFVGRSGQLLDKMLAAIGLKRGDNVYIANAVKCRPPHNRTPEDHEIALCRPYLERQIALIRPKLILALGRPAVQSLTGESLPIRANRKQFFPPQRILGHQAPMLITYHPSYLLRNAADKAHTWEDLCLARERMQKEQAGDD